MIRGIVNSELEATIRLTAIGASSRQSVVAVVDTGFDGWLTLPSPIVSRLGLRWRRRGRGLLADGSESQFDIYEGVVVWNGRRLAIPIDGTESDPLVGMALMAQHRLTVDIRHGGNVLIEQLSPNGHPRVS